MTVVTTFFEILSSLDIPLHGVPKRRIAKKDAPFFAVVGSASGSAFRERRRSVLDVAFRLQWSYKGKKGNETLSHTAIGNFTTAARDWSPAFREIATEQLEPAVKEQFETMGHGTWAELAPSTIKQKGNDTVLFKTGDMYRSFQHGEANHVENISRDKMIWGSIDPKALFHQTGTGSGFQRAIKGTGRGVPMRKILELD